jgi:hypothetical protein
VTTIWGSKPPIHSKKIDSTVGMALGYKYASFLFDSKRLTIGDQAGRQIM